MHNDGFIKKVGVGTWRITEKGLRHYGMADGSKIAKLPQQIGGRGPSIQNGSGVRRLILTALNSGSQLLARDLRRLLEENQYSVKNMTGTVSKMKGEGLITSDGGVYSLTDEGRSILAEVAAQPKENSLES
jgi:predicted transcriptional regulator